VGVLRILSSQENAVLRSISVSLGVPRDSLYNLIYFESRFDPRARNAITGARGLIQFMPKTARAMGFSSADALVAQYPDVISQLNGPVFQYLRDRAPFSGSEQDLYMSVFYPAARSWSPWRAFPDSVQRSNPGVITPGDYIRKVRFSVGLKYAPAAGVVLLVLVGVMYYLTK